MAIFLWSTQVLLYLFSSLGLRIEIFDMLPCKLLSIDIKAMSREAASIFLNRKFQIVHNQD